MIHAPARQPAREQQLDESVPREDGCDVVLVVPPFASANWPALGVSILAQGVREAGVSCVVQYPNLDLWRELGHDLYNRISLTTTRELAGELLFASYAFDATPTAATARERIAQALGGRDRFTVYAGGQVTVDELVSAVCAVSGLLDRAVDRILELGPAIVGFSAVFQQTAASIALARKLEERAPHVVTVLGGGLADWPMGSALLETTDVFDFIFSGEADAVFPEFCSQLVRNGVRPSQRVIRCMPIVDLESTPRPRYDDWFNDARDILGGGLDVEPDLLHFESSRGCWWGQKSHCTFCGLNAHGMVYRRKSDARVLSELRTARTRWSVTRFFAVDNIMPFELTRGMLQTLAEEEPPFELFYEVKANLNDAELDLFVRAGLRRIQPGVESLSTPVLKLMRKGVTGPQNIRLLRECRAREIDVDWLWIVGLPGEQLEWVESAIGTIPALEHLQPPGISHLRIDRFSPYFETPEAFSIRGVRPLPVYEHIFPSGAPLDRIAYHFVGDWPSALEARPDVAEKLMCALETWSRAWSDGRRPELRFVEQGSHGVIVDTRACAEVRESQLTLADRQLLDALDTPRRTSRVDCDGPTVQRLLDRRWVMDYDGYLLSIVVRAPAPVRPEPNARRAPAFPQVAAQ